MPNKTRFTFLLALGMLLWLVSFVTAVVVTAVDSFRHGMYAGAVVALVGLVLLEVDSLFRGRHPGYVLANSLTSGAFPVSMWAWGDGKAHGYAWLWIMFWMLLIGLVLYGLTWLSNWLESD